MTIQIGFKLKKHFQKDLMFDFCEQIADCCASGNNNAFSLYYMFILVYLFACTDTSFLIKNQKIQVPNN